MDVVHFSIPSPEDPKLSKAYGSYELDEQYGFKGKLFIPEYQMSGPGFLDIPENLNQDLLTVVTERGNFATLCYPQFNRRNWNNLSVLSVDFRFRFIIDDLRIDADEKCVRSIEISSPSIASLVGIHPVQQVFHEGMTEGSAKFNLTDAVVFAGTDFNVSIDSRRAQGTAPDGSEVYFRSDTILNLEFAEPADIRKTINRIRMLDDMVSVLSGAYAAIKGIRLGVILDGDSSRENRTFPLRGYGTGYNSKSFVHRRDTIAKPTLESPWSEFISRFQEVWDANAVCFKWFRSAQVNDRYVEERFSYAIRLAELYFRPTDFSDTPGIELLAKIRSALAKDPDALTLLNRRVAPMLQGSPSLVATLRSVSERYPELEIWDEYKPAHIVRLRGKEMHGSDNHYTGDEYQCMYDVYLGLLAAFRIDVLSQCGFDRFELAANGRKSRYMRDALKNADAASASASADVSK